MRIMVIGLLILSFLVVPVSGESFTAPPVPDSVEILVPEQPETFSEGLATVLREAAGYLFPALRTALGSCVGMIAVVLLSALVGNLPGATAKVTNIVTTVAVALLLISPSNTLIQLAADTVAKISEYGKLLIPVMAGSLAAQGGVSTSAALYAGTVFFDALLSGMISKLIVPILYIFIWMSVASSATGEEILSKLVGFVKWMITWCLKTILYVFTGYMGITGVISGTTDAAAMKATKLTISGMVPVVGGILSDASEAVLVSAGLVKSAIGVYGVVVIAALWIQPFIQIGAQYLMLKMTAGICGIFGGKEPVKLIESFSAAMGILLAMTGAVSLILMVSVVCFMRGVAA